MDKSKHILIVLFSGKRYSGKSTLARHAAALEPVHQNDCCKKTHFETLAFADELKREYSHTSGVDLDLLYTPLVKEKYRDDLIKLAKMNKLLEPAYFARKVWENRMWNLIENDYYTHLVFFIEDFRFESEDDFFASMIGKHPHLDITVAGIRINATDEVRAERGWKYDEAIDNDISECELDKKPARYWEGIIDNNTAAQSESDYRQLLEKSNVIPILRAFLVGNWSCDNPHLP